MQQRKFTSWMILAMVAIVGLLVSKVVMAAVPISCTTENGSVTLAIDNTGGNFPLVINDNNADTSNYCGNTNPANYPCSVFRYTISNSARLEYQHAFFTIPYCDNAIKNYNGNLYPVCPPPASQGTPSWVPTGACGSQVLRISDINKNSTNTFIALKGNNLGLGVNTITLLDHTPSTGDLSYYCVSKDSSGNTVGGILGPACSVPEVCKPNPYAAKTTNICLPNVNGQVLKLDVVNKEIEAVYQCPTTDTGCKGTICDPEGDDNCNVGSGYCIKQKTYEVEAKFYDENGVVIDGGSAFKVTDVGGTVEEAIGYFVVSDSCPETVCISGLAGRTICMTKQCTTN